MRITTIAGPGSAPTCAIVELSAGRALRTLLWDDPEKQEREHDKTDFEKLYHLRCNAVHICVFRDVSARCAGRRLLHYEWRSGGAWLRLSEHGDMPGRILRHRRHVLAQCLVQEFQRCHGLSTKAATATKRASAPERTQPAITGRLRSDSNGAAPEVKPGGRKKCDKQMTVRLMSQTGQKLTSTLGAKAVAAPPSR
jgi:hypothetical protein